MSTLQVDPQIMSLAQSVESTTGEDKYVVLAHWNSEQKIDSLSSWQYAGFNPAGMTQGNSNADQFASGVKDVGGHKFLTFPNAEAGAKAYAAFISSGGPYQGIRDAIKTKNPQKELEAIANSPWDEGHYGGDGRNLYSSYRSITGEVTFVDPPPLSWSDIWDGSWKNKASENEAQKNNPVPNDVQKVSSNWLFDKMGITLSYTEIGIVVLGSIAIVILLIILVKG